ncbi:hypothetical protein UFVDC4_00067 [Staphylococcus phage vB_SauM-UFV_DC4]|nr:hypothetical protein UFVDC4_00067 [Staphylococcus phage vB_SauM-UFV_DC4]
MKYLNRLKNLKFYSISGYKIKAIDEEIKDKKKDQLVIYKGFKENSFTDFLNSGLLYHQNFKNIYTPRLYRTQNRRTRLLTNITDYQKEIKSKSYKQYRVERNEKLFKGRNYIVDSTKFIDLEDKSLMTKNFNTVLNSIKSTFNSLNNTEDYNNLLYVINVDGYNKPSQQAIRPNTKDFMSSLFMMIKNQEELPHGENQNVNLLFVSLDNGIMFKFDYKDYNKLNMRLRQRLRRIIDTNTQALDTDEISKVEDDDNTEAVDGVIKKKAFDNVGTIDPIEAQNDEVEYENDEQLEKISNKIDSTISYIRSLDNTEMDVDDEYNIAMIIEKELNDNKDLIDIDTETLYSDVLDKNDSFKSIKRNIKNKSSIGDEALKNTKKILALSKKQDEYLNDLEDFSFSEDKLIDREINENINNINEETINNIASNDFDISYMQKTFNKDFIDIMKSFNDNEDIPVFINKMNIEDNSDSQSLKNTVKVQFRSPDGLTHNVKFDVPKVIDGKYMKLNGGKKVLTKQLMMWPIVKYKPDTVWITTNYNKFIIEKFGYKENAETEWIKKVIEDDQVIDYIENKSNLSVKKGNASLINNKYVTSVIYNSLSRNILNFQDGTNVLEFNQRSLLGMISDSASLSKIDYDQDKYFPIGYNINKSKLILADKTESVMYECSKSNIKSMEVNIFDYIIDKLDNEVDFGVVDKKFSKNIQSNKTMAFSRVKITNKLVPTILLLGFYKGLTNILDLYEVDYKFTTENERISIHDKKNKIKFQDGYLIYSTDKLRFDLLMSGLTVLPTSQYNFSDFETETPYLEYFNDKFYSRNVGKGIKNTMDLAMDPITKEVLRDLKLPDNMVELLLLANTMLEDVSARDHNDMGIYRVRGPEQINALLYKMMANAYKEYSDSYNNKNPKNISVKQDQLIKTIMEQPTVDEVSDLNPNLEIDKMTSVTFKGPAGRNSEQSYEPDIRSYDESMQGILGISTPDSNKVGIVRQLSYDTQIKSTRGYTDGSKKDVSDTALYTPLELLNPYTSRHADSPRIGMTGTQAKHLIATKTNDRPLVGSGVDKSLAYQISDTFAFKAKEDGKVTSINEKTGLMLVEYINGDKDVIDISEKLAKNSNGGFYQNNKLTPQFEVGKKFNKGQVLAKNDSYFAGSGSNNDIQFAAGKLSKVAVASSYGTYEDSSIISNSMSEAMSTKVTMKKTVNLASNTNIQYIVKEGQNVRTGDPLMIFENSFDDEGIGSLLDKIGSEFEQEIQDISNRAVRSKYTGEIKKVNIYYNDDIENMSPTLAKLVNGYINKSKSKYREYKNAVKDNKSTLPGLDVDIPAVEKINSEKIKGEKVDGVLIEIFTEYEDDMSIGDKISFYGACKTVIADVTPPNESPYAEYRPDEEIEAIFSPLSIVSRMTTDIYLMLATNKALIELKRKVKDML